MKTSRFFSLLAMAGLLASCSEQDIQMRTTIQRDGSCWREVSFTADSATLVGHPDAETQLLLVLSDSVWVKTWGIKGDTARHAYPMTVRQYGKLHTSLPTNNVADTLSIFAERGFSSVEEMAAAPIVLSAGMPLLPQASLTKRFRWFYTYYTYEETYLHQTQLLYYPLDKFLNDDEASYWFTGEPDLMQGYSPIEKKETYDMLEEQCDRWLVANYVAAAYDAVEFKGTGEMCDSLYDLSLDESAYRANRDSLVSYALDHQFSLGDDIDSLFISYFGDGVSVPAFASSTIERKLDTCMNAIVELMSLKMDYWLVLPGKIVDAGTGILDEGAVRYRLTGNRLIPHDYTITATSRAVNVWAFVVTILVILLAVVTLFLSPRRRTN